MMAILIAKSIMPIATDSSRAKTEQSQMIFSLKAIRTVGSGRIESCRLAYVVHIDTAPKRNIARNNIVRVKNDMVGLLA